MPQPTPILPPTGETTQAVAPIQEQLTVTSSDRGLRLLLSQRDGTVIVDNILGAVSALFLERGRVE